ETPQWSSWLNQPTAQIYHVSADYRFPYWVTGAQQDSGAVGVRTRGKFAGISMRDWEPLCAGGESGYTAADPLRPGILYGASVAASRADGLGRHRRRFDPGDDERWPDVAERDAARHLGMEPRHHDRGIALRSQRSVRGTGPASARGFRAVHLPHARRWQDVAE